ncbi:symmetrical bis(5'-nucleosyl)-tetraphosphatase [Aliiglaciecola litoralis]|uniref:bis(5'-nucleosyl)-tetraphosphatase (symmetrical) n=1 Tax=Aliiglaciecola litoralis TaxID=582857 RepID=A0ABN1LQV6_9ALTE
MADFIVGDIQGCYSGLRRLLDKVKFDPQCDKLWGVGDLIARGPDSLKTLSFLYDLGVAFDTVLGNHDLHFLAIYAGLKTPKRNDNLSPLLRSDRVDELAHWLRTKPLALRLNKHSLISHAGLYPKWSFKKAVKLSEEVSTVLRSEQWLDFLSQMYGNQPDRWDPALQGIERLRFITNAFTRMRYIKDADRLEFETKTAPTKNNTSIVPWFNVPNVKMKPKRQVIFGHWATLMGQTESTQYIALDTGYVWGNAMTLLNLQSGKKTQVQNKGS